MCRLILLAIGTSILLPFLGSVFGGQDTVDMATSPSQPNSYSQTVARHVPLNLAIGFANMANAYRRWPSTSSWPWPGSKHYQNWWAKRGQGERKKRQGKLMDELMGRKETETYCENLQADVVVTVLSYNEIKMVVMFAVCKQGKDAERGLMGYPTAGDQEGDWNGGYYGNMEMGCAETHPTLILNSHDDLVLMLPEILAKIVQEMMWTYGPNCFRVYYRYAEILWDIPVRVLESDSLVSAITTTTGQVIRLV